MSTPAINTCPKCQRPVPNDAPHGLCPACLSVVMGSSAERADQGAFALEFGPYELLDEIGRGGAGVVFRARDHRADRLVALKILTSGRFASSAERERFAREAQAVANLRHPGIAPFLDVGEADGQPYLAMRWIEGQSLAARTRRGLPPLQEAIETILQAAHAIQYAHERGIIHRDLKPSNILVTPAGEVCIVDFGLARHLEQDVTLTRSGEALGTPGFMPPEQCGQHRTAPGPGSDVYALGSVLYFTLTGRPPFLAGSHHETVKQVLCDEPVAPRRLNPAIPRDLETICLKCLEKEPHKRYVSAAAFAADLQRFARNEPIYARSTGTTTRTWRWCRQHRPATASALLIIALVAGFSWHNWRTLAQLRNTAPSLIALAESLATTQKFPEALERVEVALRLRPHNADYLVLKANILQALLRIPEARDNYVQALRIDSSLAVARQNLSLCEKLLETRRGQSDWTMESLRELYQAAIRQGRSAEGYAIFRHLESAENKDVEFLQSRLTAAGITNRLNWWIHKPAARDPNDLAPGSSRYLQLDLFESSISDLAPLRGIPLNVLHLSLCTNVADLQALRGMPLVRLGLIRNEVADLSPLAGMPLEFLWVGFTRVQDLNPLRSIPALRVLFLHNTDVRDLAPLQELALEELQIGALLATSLESLRGMPLTKLQLRDLHIADLSPLASLRLQELRIEHLDVSDLSPLRGLPLRALRLIDCPVLTDLSPLKGCQTLEQLVVPLNARNFEFLMHLPNLREISFTEQLLPAEDFWKAYRARNRDRN